jgi:hypothetical protein
MLFAGCAAFPLYLFPSGGLQIAHLLLLCAAMLALLNHRVRFSAPAALLLALAGVAFFREAIAILNGAPISSVIQAFFVIFNLATIVAVQTTFSNTGSAECYRWGIPLAGAIALAALLITGVQLAGEKIEQRAIGSFQNPNQLAYFSTILFSLTALLYTFDRLSGRMTIVLVAICTLLVSAAASKSGIVGILFGLTMLCMSNNVGRVVGVALVALVLGLWQTGILDFEEFFFVQRLQDIGADRDDSLAARGYGVLLEGVRGPFSVWFGLGEIAVREANHGNEIHSTYVAYLGLYGLVGGLLYLAFLGSWVWSVFVSVPLVRFAAIVAPPLLFGIAHNGTRFSIFYVLAALSFSLSEQRRAAARPLRRGAEPGRQSTGIQLDPAASDFPNGPSRAGLSGTDRP